MANHTGVEGQVKVGTNVMAEVRSFNIDTTAEILEDTALTDTSRTYQIGKKGGTCTVDCWWDVTDTNGQEYGTPFTNYAEIFTHDFITFYTSIRNILYFITIFTFHFFSFKSINFMVHFFIMT